MRVYIATLCLVAGPAWAHHSAAQFDFDQTVMVTGVIKEMDVRNPHTKLVLEVTNEDGVVKDIEFEGHSRNNIYRRGWRPSIVAVGDTIKIGIAPTRDGSDGGYVKTYILGDGTEF